ncbi:MAG: hypothetical protein NTW21_18870 [Verrucomicrobia bacterium]|nr:hypothetical protein [Verrucomicrobiota bacterium]
MKTSRNSFTAALSLPSTTGRHRQSLGLSGLLSLGVLTLLGSQSAMAIVLTWTNTGTDFNTSGNWTGTTIRVPDSRDSAKFSVDSVTDPNLSSSATIKQLSFGGGGTISPVPTVPSN